MLAWVTGKIFDESGKHITMAISPTGENIKSLSAYRDHWLPIENQTPWVAISHALEALQYGLPFMFLAPGETPEMFDALVLEAIQRQQLSCEVNQVPISLFSRSSGSSGRPKLVARTFDSWLASFEAHQIAFNLEGTKRWLVPGSPVYSATIYHCFLGLYLGKDVYLQGSLSPRITSNLITRYQLDTLLTVPTRLGLILNAFEIKDSASATTSAPPSDTILRTVITVGERLTLKTAVLTKQVCFNADCWHYYGASELGQVTFASYEAIIQEPTLLGIPFKEVLVTQDSQSNIIVSSPYCALNYGSFATVYDKGFWDGERLYFKGREDLQINRYGRKINLEPLQELLLALPEVKDCWIAPTPTLDQYHLHLFLSHFDKHIESDIQDISGGFSPPIKTHFYIKPVYSAGGKLSWHSMKALTTTK